MLRHEALAKTLLYSPKLVEIHAQTPKQIPDANVFHSLYDFLPYIEKTTFGIACDAMANFRVSSFSDAFAHVWENVTC